MTNGNDRKRRWTRTPSRMMDEAEYDEYESLFIRICEALSANRADASWEIFAAGMQAMLQKLQPSGSLSEKDQRLAALLEIRQEVRSRQVRSRVLEQLYLAMPLDEFIERTGPEGQEFIAHSEAVRQKPRLSNAHAKAWLEQQFAVVEELTVEEIRQRAERDGLIPDDADYTQLRRVASKLGYTNRDQRGLWRKPVSGEVLNDNPENEAQA